MAVVLWEMTSAGGFVMVSQEAYEKGLVDDLYYMEFASMP